jgi:hypothetical protein
LSVPHAQAPQRNNNVEHTLNVFTVQHRDSNASLDLDIIRSPFSTNNRTINFICMRRTARTSPLSTITMTHTRAKISLTRHNKFAKQILLINIIVILASVFSILVSLNLVLISYTELFYLYASLLSLRYILRLTSIVVHAGIPIVSWMLYPGTFHFVQSNNWFMVKLENFFEYFLLLIRNQE